MGTVLIVLFGILLPAVTLAIELASGMCAQSLFDPIPTFVNVVLVASVPVFNLLALLCPIRGWIKGRPPLLWANGVVLGITLVYSLAFVLLMPVAVIAILFFGLGLLPLAPFLSLLCAIALRRRLARMPATGNDGASLDPAKLPHPLPSPSLKSLFGGAAIGILLLLAAEAQTALTLVWAEMASSESPERAAQGIGLLRTFGSRDTLLQACYQNNDARNPFGSRRSRHFLLGQVIPQISRESAQQVFFRVTGDPYNSASPPPGAIRFVQDEFEFDPDLGGESVAGRRKGLSLGSSRIDAQLHPDDAVAYIEWTMAFKNDHPAQREARAVVLLPPGGVVSRVRLWINGEPREAAFGGTGQVREAYKKVAVQRRRDPLLVTWAGNDRVLIQCFPVPPHGEMKICLGVTTPLTLPDLDTATLRLPCFAERNFNIGSQGKHSLWIESDSAYKNVSDRLHQEKASDAKHVLRGSMNDDELSADGFAIAANRSASAIESWTPDIHDPKKIVLQKVVAGRLPAKRQIAVVVDGSRGMADHYTTIAKTLAATAPDVKWLVLLAGDTTVAVSDAVRSDNASDALAHRFHTLGGKGGCDNIPALLRAFEETNSGVKTIVWIHTSQPVMLQPADPLIQWLERDKQATLYDFAISSGTNRLLEQLGCVGSVQSVPRCGSVHDDLQNLFSRLCGKSDAYRLERTSIEAKPPVKAKASSHIARLWAADQVMALIHTGKPGQRAEAAKLAAAYQLITPVSGAVVLENQQQYDEAKLKPADPDSVPSTPEPATWILLLTALPWLAWHARKRRRKK